MQQHVSIGDLESKILRYVADHAPISVRDVAEHVALTTGQARTTVLTVMDRLRRKGYLTRSKRDGVYQYSARTSKAELMQNMVRDFVTNTLEGMTSPFVAYLAREGSVSKDELTELKRLVQELEEKHRRS